MGSLMAGWDSHNSDPNLMKFKRNKSLTKEEINAFWREKKRVEEEHLKAISSLASDINPVKEGNNQEEKTSLAEFMKKNAWWTSSNWAFLNEPPVLESSTKRYASQFHIANLATSKTNPGARISSH